MRAYVLEATNKIPVLQDRPLGIPRADEVLVRTTAVAIHPVDRETCAGGNAVMLPMSRPFVPGLDFAGTVSAVGSAVTDLPVGTSVYGYRGLGSMGAWAEEQVVPRAHLARAPEGVQPPTLATLPLPALCALQALDTYEIPEGSRVLVHGGAGAVGSVAVQIFASRGLHVIATAGGDDLEWVESLGAKQVLDYRTGLFGEVLSDIDMVFDTVGGKTLKRSFGVVSEGGVVISLVAVPSPKAIRAAGMKPPLAVGFMLPALGWLDRRRASRVEARYAALAAVPDGRLLEEATRIAEDGGLQTRIDRTFEWAELPEALKHFRTGKQRGRLVITN